MQPLQTTPLPNTYVLLALTTSNSWPLHTQGNTVRMAYIATDSNEPVSFVTLQGTDPNARVASRPARFDDLSGGVVVELHLTTDLQEGEAIQVALAQAGATIYYPPQQIDDTDDIDDIDDTP